MAVELNCSDVDLLSKRLSLLEAKVYGKYGETMDANINVTETILSINNKINQAMTGRERIKSVLKRFDELERYLNPKMGTSTMLEDKVKINIILNEEQQIHDTVAQLQKIQALKSVLDSEHIKAAPSHVDKLTLLSKLQLKQEEDAAAFAGNVQDLVNNYNTLVHTICQQFVQWDELVTKLEIAAAPKKKLIG